MLEKNFVVTPEEGLHATPAVVFAKEAAKFQCDLKLYKGNDRNKAYNPKKLLSVMTIGAGHGDQVTIVADGPDEAAAMKRIKELFDKQFKV